MLTASQLKGVQELINIIIETEQNLEAIRITLSEQPLFSMKPIFERFDQARRGVIDSADVLAFCEDNGIDITGAEAYYLTKQLDKNQDSRVTFEEYDKSNDFSLTAVLLPKDNSRSRVVTALREPYFITKNMMLPNVIEEGVADFFRELLHQIRKQQHVKHRLLSQDDFNIFNVQRMIDTRNKGFIDIDNLTKFVQSNNLQVDTEELKYFFWHGDQNEDGQISFQEFIEILMNTDMKPRQAEPTPKTMQKTVTRTHQYQGSETRKSENERPQQKGTPEQSRVERAERTNLNQLSSQQQSVAEPYQQERFEQFRNGQQQVRSTTRIANEVEYRSITPEPIQHNYMPRKHQFKQEHVYDQDPGSFRTKETITYQRAYKPEEETNQRFYDYKEPEQRSQYSFGSKQRSAKQEHPVQKVQVARNSPVKVYAYNLHQQMQEDESVSPLPVTSSARYLQPSTNQPSGTSSKLKSQYSTPVRNNRDNENHYLNITPDQVLKKQLQSYPPPYRSFATPERSVSKRELATTPEKQPDGEQSEYSKYINHLKSNPKQLKCHILEQDTFQVVTQSQPPQPQAYSHASNPTYHLFRLLLKEVLLMREVEELKRQLSLRNDFNLLDAFRLFDQQGFGRASPQDLEQGLKAVGVQPTQQQISLLLKQYSKRKENFLRYSDFTRMILPQTPDYQVLLQNRAPTFNQSNALGTLFSNTTIQFFKDLLQAISQAEEVIKRYKSDIRERPDVLFQHMDQEQKGVLDENDFRNLFASYDVHPTALELRRVINRFDPTDECVTQEAFCNQIS